MIKFVDGIMDRNYENTFILRRPRVAIFADIIKIVTMFIKTSLKTQKMLKELEIMYFLYIAKFTSFR